MPNVLTMGSFDGAHPGHIGLLQKCRVLAGNGRVIASINTDEFIEKFKGHAPLYTYAERRIMLAACRYVDVVIGNDGEAQPEIIEQYLGEGDILVIGDDWAKRDYLAQIGLAEQRDFLDKLGIVLVYLPRTGSWSTTEIRERLR